MCEIEITKSPLLRFKAYTEAWEQLKLKDLAVIYDGTHQTPNYIERGIMFLSVENIKDLESKKYISEEDFQKEFKIYPQKGDILMTRIGDVGTANLVKTNQRIAYYVSLALFKTQRVEASFLLASISSDFVQKELWKRTLHIAFPKKINKNEIEKIAINVPHKEEQCKIGAFFEQLDVVIKSSQRELELLQLGKQTLTSKLFPQEGELIPEIRFKEFTDDWKLCKWSDAFLILPSNSLSRAELNAESGVVKNVHYGDVLIKYGEVLDVTKEKVPYISNKEFRCITAALLQNGDVIMADAAEDETVGKCSEIIGLSNQKIVSGLHTIPCRPNESFARGYLGYYMNSRAYHNQLLPLIQGSKISSISKSALKDTSIIYPKLDEQKQIGLLFSNLDKLITLHQHKLENIKKMKKALLKYMFV